MKKFWTIVVSAFFVMLLPFAGFSPSFDARLQFILGLVIAVTAFFAARDNFFGAQERSSSREPEPENDPYQGVVSPIETEELEEVVK